MGNPKLKWTPEEEKALRDGVARHGVGKWKSILSDPLFNHLLFARSNIDLKDKWRNMSVAIGPRDKSTTQKWMFGPADSPATSLPTAPTSSFIAPSSQDAPTDTLMLDSSKPLPGGTNASKYDPLIYDALSNLKEPNGSDLVAIATYIEQIYEVPQTFKKNLRSRLNCLVKEGKLEKVGNCFKTKRDDDAVVESKIPAEADDESMDYLGDTVEEACRIAAHRIAEAENKSYAAAEAFKEAERLSILAEEADVLVQALAELVQQYSD
ncbi:hypothetical protein ABFS82_12G125600 [Erythranthe guttata]|uniref:telomere repeat-binding factor 4-like n=1 Tax=Erythranthe guttata TaxID=4155 RepID=UPI00064DFB36|nr:PREDICTED: telomere repeat-binding factor 4-like [Erythranthe guttata]|eukprot:XP_012848020.1 PREDICTED: telomere repeat-binding factor 4-like [Erythranthe guttata]